MWGKRNSDLQIRSPTGWREAIPFPWFGPSPSGGESRGGREGIGTHALSTLGEAGKLAAGYIGELDVCGNSKSTIRHYAYALGLYLRHLADGSVDFRHVEYKDLITFLQALRLKGNRPATVRARFGSVASWYEWLKRVRVVKDNPCDMVPAIKVDKPLPQFFTEEEMEKLRKAARSYRFDRKRNVAILEFIYASGCRRGEVSKLDIDDIHAGENAFATIRETKGRRDRLVILDSPSFLKAWEAYLPIRARALAKWERPTEKAAFITKFGKRIGPNAVYDVIRALCEHAGTRVLYPHAIRHSAATHMLNNGADLLDIKEQLGHKSLSTTEVYLHVALERRRAQYRKSHPAAGPSSSDDTSYP